jgi:hypothetical protein
MLPLLGVSISVLIRLKNIETEPSSRLSKELTVIVLHPFSFHSG